MISKNKVLSSLFTGLFISYFFSLKVNSSPEIPRLVAENTCWYMTKGQGAINLVLAFKWALNPMMLLMDERGVTPMYVTRNGLFISKNLKTYFENDVEDKFTKETMKKILAICPNSLSPSEKKSIEEELKNYQSKVEVKKSDFDIKKETYVVPNELRGKASKHYQNGSKFASSGKYEDAIREYSEVIAIDPYNANVFNDRGISKCNLKQYLSGIEDYNMAIKIYPKHSAAYFNKGNCKFMMKSYEESINDFNQAIKINPRFSHAYHSRGTVKFELGDVKNACSDWIKASRMNNYRATKPMIKEYCK